VPATGAGALTFAPSPATGRKVVLGVGLVALAARLWPVLAAGTLRGVSGYDDGVYFAVAQRLLAGIVPYRDEVFLHPPGIAVGLAPFAGLAGPVGDSWALALARVAFMVLGAMNAMVVARILSSRGLFAAAVGGGAYALWGATIAAEQTLYLEAPIGLGLLVALAALRRAGPGSAARSGTMSRALAVSGLALGVAVTFKIWVTVDVAALGALVLARWGPRAVARWLRWGLVGAAPILVPFLVLAPGRLWFDVVRVQSVRPMQGKTIPDRLGAVGLAAALNTPAVGVLAIAIGGLLLTLVATPLVAAIVRRSRPDRWPDPVWWGILAAAPLAALAFAPSFYQHYVAFAVPALTLLLGAGAGHLLGAARGRGAQIARFGPVALVALALTVGFASVLTRPLLPPGGRVDNAELATFAARRTCVWARNPSYLQVADAAARQDRAGCRSSPDLVGAWLALQGGGNVPGYRAPNLDTLVLEQLRTSDGAFLSAIRPTQGFGPRARTYLRAHFVPVGTTGEIGLWARAG
jgi:hypothetical protein